jgi:LEA14-like dessication related protein
MSRLIFAAALSSLTLACAGAPPSPTTDATLSVGEQKLDEREQRLSGLSALLQAPVSNAGDAPARATLARWELVVDGQVVRKGETALDATVPAAGEALIDVPVEFEYARTGEELRALASRKEPLQYAVRGVMTVGGKALEFARAASVRPPRLPTAKLESLEVLHGKESGLTLNAGVEVDNPNAFAVPIQGLRWAITWDGKPLGEGLVGKGDVLKPASHVRYELSLAFDPDQVKEKGLPTGGALGYELTGQLEAAPAQIELKHSGQARIIAVGE